MALSELFDPSLLGRKDQIGLEWLGSEYTFGEIEVRSNRLARLFLQRGLISGDRLCVHLPNRIEMIDLYLACIKTGVIFVPINILYREREIAHIVGDAEPKAVVAVGGEWDPDDLTREAQDLDASRPHVSLHDNSPAAIVYTSGTTGVSKGAILTHSNFGANALNLVQCWKISCDDRFLLPLPLFHVHALGNGLHCWLISGCRMRLLERFEHQKAPAEFLDFQPTLFFGVPTIYVRLLDISDETARKMGERMRLFVSGSAPLPAQVLEDFRARYGHVILERYGMTETLMNMSNPYEGERRAGTVGLPLPTVSARILNPERGEVQDGESGEVYLQGPNVFPGYWRNHEATRAAFHEGWFKTGDIASRSADGYFTLQGRRTDLIISSGFNIYPREIEELLLEQPGVAEAAVAGVPDRLKGEVPVAYIVPKGAIDIPQLEQACRSQLASFKVPRTFLTVDALPRTALGKVQKHLLPKPPE